MDNNPFEAPRSSSSSAPVDPDRLYVRDGVLFAPTDAALPEMCAACGATDIAQTKPTPYSWSPLWARMTILLSPLIALIAILVTRKSASLTVSLCDADVRRVARYTRIGWAGLLAGIALIVGSVFAVDALQQVFFVMLAAGIVLSVVAIWAFTRTMIVRVTYVDKLEARYKGVHPAVLAVIERGP